MQTPTFNTSLCVFCQQIKKKGSIKLRSFATDNAGITVRERLRNCIDKTVCLRLQDIDLVANDIKYHEACYRNFHNDTRPNSGAACQIESASTVDPIDQLFKHLQPDLELGKAFYLNELPAILKEVTGEQRRKDSIKRSLISGTSEITCIPSGTVNGDIIFSTSKVSLYTVINQAFQSRKHPQLPTEKIHQPTTDDCIKLAARSIRADIKKKSQTISQLSDASIQKSYDITPSSLISFLKQVTTDITSDNDDNECHIKLLSIAQDIISVATHRITPKQLSISMMIKHLTGNKLINERLSQLGHTCSYTELQRMETTFASALLKQAEDIGVIIPTNITKGRFLQMAMDNWDTNEETIDGKSTTHCTAMVLYQETRGDQVNAERENLSVKPRETALQSDQLGDLLCLETYVKPTQRAKPGVLPHAANIEKLYRELLEGSKHLEITYFLSRILPVALHELNITPQEQCVPSWSAFNVRHQSTTGIKRSNIGYCPMLDYKSTEPATVYTVLKMIQKISTHLEQRNAVITFDWAIYHVAREIQWDRPNEFANVIIRMGGFHLVLAYLGAIGKMHSSSGMKEILEESGMYSSTIAKQILAGGQYNRCVRAHKLMYETLFRLLFEGFCEWMQQQNADDPLLELELTGMYNE